MLEKKSAHTLVDSCEGNKDGTYVSWKPYLELLAFVRAKQSERMTYYFFMDTTEGEVVE